jgi:hypothetical protein
MSETVHWANPDETIGGECFEFWFGAYGWTRVRVFAREGALEKALETAAEWLIENAPGLFVTPDYQAACLERECRHCSEGECNLCREAAEVDLTQTECGWLPSWEWSVRVFRGGEELPEPHFDRFDVAEAHNAYLTAWHGGQGSREYARLCKLQRVGAALATEFSELTDNGKAIYRRLVIGRASRAA